ncbi:MAG: M28 family peptidase [Candidatus Caldarchaeum sp.]
MACRRGIFVPIIFAVALYGVSSPAIAFRAESITAASLRAHVEYLASDALEGRLTGSPGERAAGDYVKKFFEQHGLLPGGENGTYFQHFEVTMGGEATKNNRLRLTLPDGKTLEAQLSRDFNPLYNSDYQRTVTGELVFAGEGIATETRNDFEGLDIKDKIVVVLTSRQQNEQNSNRTKARTAKEKGAVGILFVGPSAETGNLFPMNRRFGLSPDSGIVALNISVDLFERLSGLKMSEARSASAEGRVLQGFPKGIKAEMQADIQPARVIGRNVIAILPGNDPKLKNQYIVFGAHMDHVGRGASTASGADDIFNGADDNASGTAMVMELARHFAQEKSNRRTYVFQLYSGEELGLRGSTHFVQNPTIKISDVTCMFNFDMVGNLVNNYLILDGVRSSPVWSDWIDELATGFNVRKDRPDLAGRSDHGPWERAGVPVLFFFTNEHERYHRPNDEPQYLNYEGMERIANLAIQFVKKVDAMEDMLSFRRGNQITERKPSSPEPGNRKIRVGLIPDYGDSGPGVLLAGVIPNSSAEKAGLQAGDRIIQWEEQTINDIEDLQRIFETAEPGKPVTIKIVRKESVISLTLVPDPPLVSSGAPQHAHAKTNGLRCTSNPDLPLYRH